uniref:Hypotheticial protein n=1 Tax=Schistosoma japonicum TaxID=6182 RepID=C1LKD8_SCHJA|nr:hypotheticial protein [Schistosoma japonicum]CAX75166.1 hypotheticial protein [Schistosoma japonicum]
MLFTMLIVIVSLHSFVLTYANNSTNSAASNSSIALISSMHFDNYSVHCKL